MKGQWRDHSHLTIELNRSELLLLNNALNEVCHGLDFSGAEFHTRLGVEKSRAVVVLDQLNTLHDATPK